MHQRSPKPSASLPQSDTLATIAARVKSLIRNTLLASPDFPRLYADVVISSAPNSNEAKTLAANYQKIIDRTNMPIHPNVKSCTHVKVTGVRCGSPALRGEQFCYFHQRMLRSVKTPPQSRLHPIALIEDEEAIQASLMEVINALLRNTIDLKRAELILRALHIAVKNARRARFTADSNMVKEVPEYPAPPTVASAAQKTDFDFPPVAALQQPLRRKPTFQELWKASKEELDSQAEARVGTAAPGCPGGPEVPGRSAPSTKTNPALDPTQPKPPVTERDSQKQKRAAR